MDEQTLQQLERYFDGALSQDERRDFEARLEREPALREAVRQQRVIDSALRRLVPVPAAPPVVMPDAAETPEVIGTIAPATGNPWLRRLAVAAMVCAGLFGAWSTWQHLKPIDDGRVVAKVSPDQYYRDMVASNMQVYYVCKPDSPEFAEYFRSRLGQSVLMKAEDPAFKCLGVNKCNCLSPNTLAVLVRMNETPIIVLIDRKQCGDGAAVGDVGGLHIYQRNLGSLVMYEISPKDHAEVLDLFRNPGGQS